MILLKHILIRNLYHKLKLRLDISEREYNLLLSCNNCTAKMINFFNQQIKIVEKELELIEGLIDDIEQNYMKII